MKDSSKKSTKKYPVVFYSTSSTGQQNSLILYSTTDPMKKLRLEAIMQDWTVIRYITYPTKQEQLLAVKQNVKAIDFIRNPTKKIKKYCLSMLKKQLDF